MTKATDRRNFWRAVFHAPVRVATHDGKGTASLLDISLNGALLETNANWHVNPGEECELLLELGRGSTITMWATVMHVDGPYVGLRCEIIDLDSITHLRRLVELNSGDPAILDREFVNLIRES